MILSFRCRKLRYEMKNDTLIYNRKSVKYLLNENI